MRFAALLALLAAGCADPVATERPTGVVVLRAPDQAGGGGATEGSKAGSSDVQRPATSR